MKCKECGSKMKITETRSVPYGVRRRHKCEVCGYRITTAEIPMNHYKSFLESMKINRETKKVIEDVCGSLSHIGELMKGGE
jgi:transcriptional regulator NrdR family protein